MSSLAAALAGSGDRRAMAELCPNFPTAALAIIDFDGPDWFDVGAGRGHLERFVTPAGLGADGEEQRGALRRDRPPPGRQWRGRDRGSPDRGRLPRRRDP